MGAGLAFQYPFLKQKWKVIQNTPVMKTFVLLIRPLVEETHPGSRLEMTINIICFHKVYLILNLHEVAKKLQTNNEMN